MVEYGYINENNYLISKILEEYVERYKDKETGEIKERIVSIDEQIFDLSQQGWKPVDSVDNSQLEMDSEFYSVFLQPVDMGDKIGYHYVKEFSSKLVQQKIDKYKNELANTDYKVMKCYETSLIGKVLPYDIEKLHIDRQKLRDEINRLEDIIR